jgi:hypothetical protein
MCPPPIAHPAVDVLVVRLQVTEGVLNRHGLARASPSRKVDPDMFPFRNAIDPCSDDPQQVFKGVEVPLIF